MVFVNNFYFNKVSEIYYVVLENKVFQALRSIVELIRSPGEGNGNPFQYSCLENPMDRGAWQSIVHGVARVRHDLVTKSPGKIYTKHRDERLLSAE